MKIKVIMMLVFVLMFSGCATTYTHVRDDAGYYVQRISLYGETKELKVDIGLCRDKLEAIMADMGDSFWNVRFHRSMGTFKYYDPIVVTLLTYYPNSKDKYLEFTKSLSEYNLGNTILFFGAVVGGIVAFASLYGGIYQGNFNGAVVGIYGGAGLALSSPVLSFIWLLTKGSEVFDRLDKTVQNYNNNCGK